MQKYIWAESIGKNEIINLRDSERIMIELPLNTNVVTEICHLIYI